MRACRDRLFGGVCENSGYCNFPLNLKVTRRNAVVSLLKVNVLAVSATGLGKV